jgi:hypothetical protein
MQAPLLRLGLHPSRCLLYASSQDEGMDCVRGREASSETYRRKQKRTNLRWPPLAVRTGPIPTAPGGWGLRNPEPKGPGQRTRIFSQCRAAVARRKRGDTMIPANDPVTVCRQRVPSSRVLVSRRFGRRGREPLAVGNGWRNHAIVMIRGRGTVFAARLCRDATGGAR